MKLLALFDLHYIQNQPICERKIRKTRVINIGADYDLLRCAIIDTKTKQVETREKKIA